MGTRKRDNAYWLARLERERPDIHARYRAGKIASVRAACAEAGLIRLPSRLDALKREWNAAQYRERKAFVDWIAEFGFHLHPSGPASSLVLTDSEGYLTPEAVIRIRTAMEKLGLDKGGSLRTGPVMTAMGYDSRDPSLGLAVAGRWKVKKELRDRLRAWLVDQERR